MSANFTCRVCGNVPIVEGKPKPFDEVAAVYYKITDLQIVDESALPKFVCQYCYGKLVGIDWFRKMCITSYDRLANPKPTMYNQPFGSMNNEVHNRGAFEMFPNERRNHYPPNPMQSLERAIHSHESSLNYSHPQPQDIVAPNISNPHLASEQMNSAFNSAQIPQEQPVVPSSSNNKKKVTSASNSDLVSIHQRLDQIGSKMDVHSAILQRLELLITNGSYVKPHESVRDDLRQRCSETFEEFEQMAKIETAQQLTELDVNLANPVFEAKFFRYLQSVYNLTGKREGFPFFKTVVRRLIVPTVLLPYSWKGNSRSKKGDQASVVVNDKNYSFKNMFPNFVRFIYRVVSAADIEFTSEDNEKAFSDHLRQKNTEVKRFIESNGMQREACNRKRRRREPTKDDGVGLEHVLCVNDTTDGDFSYDEETFSDTGGENINIKQERLEALGSSEPEVGGKFSNG
ncbi:uncharacterized protein LOC135707355 [Ochlerotatus camptorhynchus]|uniref:uncharacterized protein LOC135707355 n=1 Tax=Ochlerotatus camptorhynchus TaxID=644619 RepID=UPI0031D8A642